MKQLYTEMILLVERLHRRFLDVVNTELERLRIDDINNVQTLILYNIGTEQITIGELAHRGYYLGSNVSYNVKKLVENKYLLQEKALHYKRSVRIKLSEKGLKLCQQIDALYERNVDALKHGDVGVADLQRTNDTLLSFERFWTGYIETAYRMR